MTALEAAFAADRSTVIDAVTEPDIALLPPFRHGRGMLGNLKGLRAEGDAGSPALELRETYAQMEERHT